MWTRLVLRHWRRAGNGERPRIAPCELTGRLACGRTRPAALLRGRRVSRCVLLGSWDGMQLASPVLVCRPRVPRHAQLLVGRVSKPQIANDANCAQQLAKEYATSPGARVRSASSASPCSWWRLRWVRSVRRQGAAARLLCPCPSPSPRYNAHRSRRSCVASQGPKQSRQRAAAFRPTVRRAIQPV